MKKLVLSAVVALAGIVGVNAQSMESLQIGAKAAYNYSNLRGDFAKALDFKGASGYNVGLYVEVPVTDRLSIQPEVLYSQEGAKLDTSINLPLIGKVGEETEFKLKNVNVPVLAKYYVVNGLNIQVGPQINFLTDSSVKLGKVESDKVLKEALSKVNFSAVVGAGYKLPMGFSVDARYTFGLTNILDKDNKDLKNLKVADDFKTGVFSVGVGYQF